MGAVTEAGLQIQDGLQIPTSYPGLVYVRGEQKTPDQKKWKTVEYPAGSVKINWESARRCKMEFSDRPKRFKDVVKADIEKLRGPDPPTFTHALIGIGLSGARPMVSAKTPYNQMKAVLGRVFRSLPARPWGTGPMPGAYDVLRKFLPDLLPFEKTKPMSVHDWIDSMPTARKGALRKAWQRLDDYGWKDSYRKFSAFVKTELLPGFAKDKGELVDLKSMLDRLIQGPRDETHVIAGPWLKPLVKQLKKLWSHSDPIFYGSCSPESLHKWLVNRLIPGNKNPRYGEKPSRTYFWCDFSMFDCTHSADSWAFMEDIYWSVGIQDPLFWKVMDAWRAPGGKIGPFKYQAKVMNASGRDDTALANAVLNGLATFVSVAAAWLRKSVFDLTSEDIHSVKDIIVLSVCGDDSLGSLPHVDALRKEQLSKDIAHNIAIFGFEAKLEMSDDISDAVYLGMRPYPTEKGWFWGKTIGRSTYKMGWTMLRGKGDLMAHITGIADMHNLCSHHVPVLSDLASRILELREGCKRTPPYLDPNKPWEWTFKSGVCYDSITLEYTAQMYSKCGRVVTKSDVLDLIKHIQGVDRLPCVLDHWLWRHMVYCDDL